MKMNSSLSETLEITVAKDTAEGLRKTAQDIGATIGEVVDRLTVQMSPASPDAASALIMEEVILITSKLSKADRQKVYSDVACSFLMACQPEQLDGFVAEAKLRRKETSDRIASLSGEEKTVLAEAIHQLENPSGPASEKSYFRAACGTPPQKLPPENRVPVSELPFDFHAVEDTYGRIYYAEIICSGVYYLGTKIQKAESLCSAEYIVVTEDSPALSPEARSYGTLLPTAPKILLYDYNDYLSKGRHVIEYEAHKYLAEHGLPLPEGRSLLSDKAFGMEVCPEYFGEFPIPADTPWGAPIRHDRLWNGLYWLETAEAGWVLAIAYPLCSDLFDETLNLAVLTDHDRENGIDNTCGYRFYTYEASCLPLYEMMDFEKDTWGPKINRAALQNAILKYFPDYATANGHAASGLPPEQRILPTPDAGTDFYRFPQA